MHTYPLYEFMLTLFYDGCGKKGLQVKKNNAFCVPLHIYLDSFLLAIILLLI